MAKTELKAQDIFKKQDIDDSFPMGNPVEKTDLKVPTEKEMQEAASPYLSQDSFDLGGKTFQIRVSNIKTQKIMARSLDSVTDFIRKLDIKPLIEKLTEKLNNRNDFSGILSEIAKDTSKSTEEKQKIFESELKKVSSDKSDDTSFFTDMAEFVKEIITYGGISNIVEMILDLYTGVVFAICKSQDNDITREWVEDNLNFALADSIFFRQLEKDHMGGMVVDFLSVLTRQVIKR